MDFADALHLASSQTADQFVTFDRKLAAKAAKLTSTRVLTLH
jgi:predicted nucleic acid-binding protein